MKFLLFNKEIKDKRKKKIKSKLFHKIKKRQFDREEAKFLEELAEVDANAVSKYLQKRRKDRVEERLTLKHATNSKFSKLTKRYNFLKDQTAKEAVMDNLRLRDKLMEKVQAGAESEEEDNEVDVEEDLESESEFSGVEVDFTNKKQKEQEKKAGVFGMKFMQENAQVRQKVEDDLESKSEADEEEVRETKFRKKLKVTADDLKKAERDELTQTNQQILSLDEVNKLSKDDAIKADQEAFKQFILEAEVNN